MIFVTTLSRYPVRVSRHTVFVDRSKSSSIVSAIQRAMARFIDDDRFIFLQPGAVIRGSLPLLETSDFDVAAYVHRNGVSSSIPVIGPFSGIGFVHTTTLAFRRTISAGAVLARWGERNDLAGHLSEAQNLLITLSEMKPRLLHLPAAYAWIEPVMRPGCAAIEPVIEHVLRLDGDVSPIQATPSVAVEPTTAPRPKPSVVVQSHFSQYTGYGKMAREILFRLSNTLAVRIDDSHKEPVLVERDLQVRIDAYKQTLVPDRSPFLRIMGPEDTTGRKGRRIVWTMQETAERVHPDMVSRINKHWDEVWTPTGWNANVFRASGVRPDCREMPLGVNPLIFRPSQVRKPFPWCRLISTSRRGIYTQPKGFVFLTIGLPGFRKGWDVVAAAFEKAFARKPDVDLVIGLTHAPDEWKRKVYREFEKSPARIWTLEGSFSEHELADIYRSSGAYVSASRGEGFNLPAAEAAACGIPVIVPDNTCHPEIFGPEAYLFICEGTKVYPEGDWISDWYKGQKFAKFGKKSISDLAEIMILVAKNGPDVEMRVERLKARITYRYTWDAAAARAAERLLAVQP